MLPDISMRLCKISIPLYETSMPLCEITNQIFANRELTPEGYLCVSVSFRIRAGQGRWQDSKAGKRDQNNVLGVISERGLSAHRTLHKHRPQCQNDITSFHHFSLRSLGQGYAPTPLSGSARTLFAHAQNRSLPLRYLFRYYSLNALKSFYSISGLV